MDGWPVWLASISRRNPITGSLVATGDWTGAQMAEIEAMMDTLLDGVGDASRERCFRMCITLCRHRAISGAEHMGLPKEWHEAPAVDLAGAPVELLWTKGIPDRPAAQPCHNPRRQPIGNPFDGLYVPVDCEECETCQARMMVRA
jgi:hypothetical protein